MPSLSTLPSGIRPTPLGLLSHRVSSSINGLAMKNFFLSALGVTPAMFTSHLQANTLSQRMKNSSRFVAGSVSLCLLSLALAPAHGQTINGPQIIGYNNANDTDTLTSLANSPYTTFIDGFLQPTANSTAADPALGFDTLSFGPTMDSSRVTTFNALESAGKKVLLSFGGAGAGSSFKTFATKGTYNGTAYTADDATQNLANILAAYVTGASSYHNAITGATVAITTYDNSAGTFKGFNGIDIDFEDTQAFQTQSSPTYDGVHFVSQLTIDLRKNLGSGYLITHAPQTVYLDPAYTQGNTGTYGEPSGAYQAILTTNYADSNPDATLTAAGQAISWLNVQFYNNSGDDGDNSVSGLVQAFENLVMENPGIPTNKFVLTLPITSKNAGDNYNFTSSDITQIVQQINAWLTGRGEGTLAGVAGFELYQKDTSQQDTYNIDLNFANAVSVVFPPTITSASTATVIQGKASSFQINATNAPTSYAATGLPAGLSINTGTGLISGTPKDAGKSAVTISATNANGTTTARLVITIAGVPVVTSAKTASATQNKAFSYQIVASNSPTSFSVSGLPTGLALNASTGLISGTPKNVGTATVTINASNAAGTGSARLTITIQAVPVITSATTATATQGEPFSYQITATGSPTSFGASGLPTGLTIDTSTGLITGAPKNVGKAAVTISATNAAGVGSTRLTFTITD